MRRREAASDSCTSDQVLTDAETRKLRAGAQRMRTIGVLLLIAAALALVWDGRPSFSLSPTIIAGTPPPLGALAAAASQPSASTSSERVPPDVVLRETRAVPSAALPPTAQPPTAHTGAARIGLLMLVVGSTFPPWWPFLVASYELNHPTYELIVVHTGARPDGGSAQKHVRYEHVPLAALQRRFEQKLGAPAARVELKFASAKGLSDLKPFYGHIFDDLIGESRYTHWGWADWDLLIGDMSAVVPEAMLWKYDAITFPGKDRATEAYRQSHRQDTSRVDRLIDYLPKRTEKVSLVGHESCPLINIGWLVG
mmetsp:Transcript_18913/g.38529  ORF Transcript_18913/g.38529 Transcript_18913/m.38529 type:complete len:311 (-) Transcript_18913:128-1060(-)